MSVVQVDETDPRALVRAGLVAPSLQFWVAHLPAPQGSKVPMGRAATGRILLVESSKNVKPWRQAVKEAAQRAAGVDELTGSLGAGFPLDGPLMASMVFTLPKPKASPKTRVTYPASRRNDVTKLARSTEDALMDAGVIVDDGHIIGYVRQDKVFPNEDVDALGYPGAVVRVWALAEVGCGG